MSRVRPLACWRLAIPILFLTPLAACRDELPTTPVGPNAAAAVNPDLTDRYIVVFQPTVADVDAMVEALTRAHGGAPGYRYYTVLKGFAATLPAAAVEGIRRNPNVAYVEPDGIATKVGSQSLLPAQWGLDRIDEQALQFDGSYTWDTDGTGVEVYIVDTGIWFAHSEFGGRATSFWDYVSNDADAGDCDGHGTHVAGTVGGATVGVARNATLRSARVLNCGGSGSYTGIIKAIDDITARKNANPGIPMVGNMSLGGGLYPPLNAAVNASVAKGVVWAVAAGNSNADACGYSPAAAQDALTVGATTSSDARSYFSNYGRCLDLFAPGSAIYSSVMRGGYESWSGTSMATPHVAGVAALYLAKYRGADAFQVNAAVTGGATPNVVTQAGTGSPNLLLYSLITGGTPPADPVLIHLGALAGSSSIVRKGWTASATATIHASDDKADGVLVTFALSGGAKGTGSCTTGSDGMCTYTKTNLKSTVGSVTFTVTGISRTGASYAADDNDVGVSVEIVQP